MPTKDPELRAKWRRQKAAQRAKAGGSFALRKQQQARKKREWAAFWKWAGEMSKATPKKIAHVATLTDWVLAKVGGQDRLARFYGLAMKQSRSGSVRQVKLLCGVYRLVEICSRQADATRKPESRMTDEEIDAKLEAYKNECRGKGTEPPE